MLSEKIILEQALNVDFHQFGLVDNISELENLNQDVKDKRQEGEEDDEEAVQADLVYQKVAELFNSRVDQDFVVDQYLQSVFIQVQKILDNVQEHLGLIVDVLHNGVRQLVEKDWHYGDEQDELDLLKVTDDLNQQEVEENAEKVEEFNYQLGAFLALVDGLELLSHRVVRRQFGHQELYFLLRFTHVTLLQFIFNPQIHHHILLKFTIFILVIEESLFKLKA